MNIHLAAARSSDVARSARRRFAHGTILEPCRPSFSPLTAPAGRSWRPRPARLRERLAARFTPTRLDRELAAGVAPEADGALALRAQRLVGPIREVLGRQVVRVVRDAHTGGHPWLAAQIPLSRREVAEAADGLAAIAARLLGPEPVAAQGVARRPPAAQRRHRPAVLPRPRAGTRRRRRRGTRQPGARSGLGFATDAGAAPGRWLPARLYPRPVPASPPPLADLRGRARGAHPARRASAWAPAARLRDGDDRARVAAQVERAEARVAARRAAVPPRSPTRPSCPSAPAATTCSRPIGDHQVVVVAGETGSGKTTQLPKLCLELGRGVRGTIAHTQPRRLAARTVAERIAEELDVPLGGGRRLRACASTTAPARTRSCGS